MTPESLTFVAGGFIADPAKVESGLKKIVEAAKEEKHEKTMPEIKWAADKHKDVTFHTMQPCRCRRTKKRPGKLFGEKLDMAVGIGKKAVYFAARPRRARRREAGDRRLGRQPRQGDRRRWK